MKSKLLSMACNMLHDPVPVDFFRLPSLPSTCLLCSFLSLKHTKLTSISNFLPVFVCCFLTTIWVWLQMPPSYKVPCPFLIKQHPCDTTLVNLLSRKSRSPTLLFVSLISIFCAPLPLELGLVRAGLHPSYSSLYPQSLEKKLIHGGYSEISVGWMDG